MCITISFSSLGLLLCAGISSIFLSILSLMGMAGAIFPLGVCGICASIGIFDAISGATAVGYVGFFISIYDQLDSFVDTCRICTMGK